MKHDGTDIRPFVAALGDVLTEGPWVAEQSEHRPADYVRLVRSDGAAVTFNHIGYGCDAGKLEVGGDYPRADGGYYFGPSGSGIDPRLGIKVSPSRGPAAVAKDIARRFLPAYLARHADAAARKNTHDRSTARADAALGEIARALGSIARRDQKPGHGTVYVDGGHIEVRPGSGDEPWIEVRTNVSLATALDMTKLLRREQEDA